MNRIVSVIIPAFNADRTLERCMRSVLEQSYSEWEAILVDDGSIDKTAAMCDQYALLDNRVKVIHQPNRGVSAARNKGLEMATGSFITFLDADDELLPDAIDNLVKKALAVNADMIIGRMVGRGKNGIDVIENTKTTDGLLTGDSFLELVLEDNPYCYGVYRILYKATFLDGMKFEAGRIVNEDSFFIFECALKKPTAAFINNGVYRHSNNPYSVTHSGFSLKKYEDILYFLERKVEAIEVSRPVYREKMYNLLVKCHMNLLQNMCCTYGSEWRARKRFSISEFEKYKSYFIPAIRQDRKMFFILSHNLYYAYCFLYFLRTKLINKGKFGGGNA